VTAHTEEQFIQAENDWDLERLYNDLTAVKGKNLTRIEKLHLRGLLCGHSPADIAGILHREVNDFNAGLPCVSPAYVLYTVIICAFVILTTRPCQV
jgi:hypothetical protein